MRKEAKELATELVRLELKLRPLLQRRGELRDELKKKLPIGEPETVENFLFHAYEKLLTSFRERELIESLGDKARLVTSPKLDSDKLDSALKLGLVKQEELEPFMSVRTEKVLLVREASGNNRKGENNSGRRNTKALSHPR